MKNKLSGEAAASVLANEQQAVEKAVRAALAIPGGKLCDSDLAQACEQIRDTKGVGTISFRVFDDEAKKLRKEIM